MFSALITVRYQSTPSAKSDPNPITLSGLASQTVNNCISCTAIAAVLLAALLAVVLAFAIGYAGPLLLHLSFISTAVIRNLCDTQ